MIPLKHVAPFLRSTPFVAHASALFCLCLWIAKAIVLDELPAPVGWFYGLGRVVDGLFSAYVAGYVFFLAFVLVPEYRNRLAVAGLLFPTLRSIAGNCTSIIFEVQRASGLDLPFSSVGEAEIKRAFEATPINHAPNAIIDFRPATMFDFILLRRQRSELSISKLFEQGRFLDPDLVLILHRIRECTFYMQTKAVAEMGRLSNTHFGVWGSSFYSYLEACRDLRDWHNENRVPGVGPFIPEPLANAAA